MDFKKTEEFEKNNTYESELKLCFYKVLTENDINVFVDVGANIGLYTYLFAKLRKGYTEVYAFEPEPTRYEYLKETVKMWGSTIKVFNVAVSNYQGEKVFYVPEDRKASGSLNKIFVERLKRPLDSFIVKTNTLDNCFSDIKIDLIKMDIEGEEINAIKGASGTLRTQNPIVMIESHMQLHNEIYTLMSKLEYEIYELNEGRFTCWRKKRDGRLER